MRGNFIFKKLVKIIITKIIIYIRQNLDIHQNLALLQKKQRERNSLSYIVIIRQFVYKLALLVPSAYFRFDTPASCSEYSVTCTHQLHPIPPHHTPFHPILDLSLRLYDSLVMDAARQIHQKLIVCTGFTQVVLYVIQLQ